MIHIVGIGIGLMLKHPWDGKLAQGLGAGIAAAGVYFAVG